MLSNVLKTLDQFEFTRFQLIGKNIWNTLNIESYSGALVRAKETLSQRLHSFIFFLDTPRSGAPGRSSPWTHPWSARGCVTPPARWPWQRMRLAGVYPRFGARFLARNVCGDGRHTSRDAAQGRGSARGTFGALRFPSERLSDRFEERCAVV